MSTQHTPGPWHVANGVQIRSERRQIAKVWMMRNGEGTANAHLIAAAPDMHEALKSMRAYLSKCPPHSEDRTGAEWGRMMDLSGAAIAKAEGKS